MRTSWLAASWVLENRWREAGARAFFGRVVPLALLNILLGASLFSSSGDKVLTAETMALNYVYFIPLLSFLAGLSSFESDLFAGLGEQVLLAPGPMLRARLLLIAVELAAPAALFAGLLVASGQHAAHLALLGGYALAFASFGLALGLFRGFLHEKSINNMVHASTWLFALGPGPFFGLKASGYHRFFPGGHALAGSWEPELFKLALVVAVSLAVAWLGVQPRRRPLYP